jgi:putative SOS response-associated peptidase YedK
MCGRLVISTPPARVAALFDAALAAGVDPVGHPSWNLGPTRRIDGIHASSEGRVLDRYRWGLIPSWAKELSFGSKTFNARAETVATKPSFRSAYTSRRLIVPVDGFYEWDRSSAQPQPHYFARSDHAILAFAGLYETWHDPANRESPPIASATIITTEANADMSTIHHRMPVILEQGTFDLWLGGEDDDRDAIADLLVPAPPGTLISHLVDPKVGNVRNDGPELIDEQAPSTLF